MDSDEDFARQLQAQFDEEERIAREQEQEDAFFAQQLASQSHNLSDSDEEVYEVNRGNEMEEVVEVNRVDESTRKREVVDLDSEDEDEKVDAVLIEKKVTVPQHTISDDDETDIEDLETEQIIQARTSQNKEPQSLQHNDSLSQKVPEHTISDDDTDVEDLEVPDKVEVVMQEASATKGGNDDTPVRKASEHSMSDDDTEGVESSTKTSDPQNADKVDVQTSSTSSNSQNNSLSKEGSNNKSKKRPLCKFGADCYRKNPWHLEEFYHPHLEDKPGLLPKRNSETADCKLEPPEKRKKESDSGSTIRKNASISKKMSFPARLASSSPYNFFVNKSFSLKETHDDPLSLVFPDLLNPQLGEIVESVQLNFMVDLEFLMSNYKAGKVDEKPLLVMYGQMEGNPRDYSAVTCTKVNLPFQYGTHHTKMMIFQYTDSLRVVVHTANLVPSDWYEKTQGYWISPAFPLLEGGKSGLIDGESPTRFKRDLVEYLMSYKAPDLTRWSHIIKKYDFSSCNVVFVGSSPGYHTGEHKDKWGHMKARRAIRQHAGSWNSSTPILVQCSSIGSLGKDAKSWLSGELGMSLTGAATVSASPPKMNVIYPSEDDVCNSSEGWMGGSCLPYNSSTHEKQTWLRDLMYCWRSNQRKRTRAMPHIKTYTRLNKDYSAAHFFLLTSANISKAAWGTLQKQNSQLFIRSYEAGVLLLPKFLTDTTEIKLNSSGFSLPYDVPLTPFPDGAVPWFMNTNKNRPDIFGRTYP